MIKVTSKSTNSTKHHGQTLIATFEEMFAVFLDPQSCGDKSYCIWELQFLDGTVFTIYDWKAGFDPEEEQRKQVDWRIGSEMKLTTAQHRELIELFI